jgi:hypothetical protein
MQRCPGHTSWRRSVQIRWLPSHGSCGTACALTLCCCGPWKRWRALSVRSRRPSASLFWHTKHSVHGILSYSQLQSLCSLYRLAPRPVYIHQRKFKYRLRAAHLTSFGLVPTRTRTVSCRSSQKVQSILPGIHLLNADLGAETTAPLRRAADSHATSERRPRPPQVHGHSQATQVHLLGATWGRPPPARAPRHGLRCVPGLPVFDPAGVPTHATPR